MANPICNHPDGSKCFAAKFKCGYFRCEVLTDTNFKDKLCPFFKTIKGNLDNKSQNNNNKE